MEITQISDDLIGQRTRRAQNMIELTKLGINCYPAQSKKDLPNQIALDNFSKYENKALTLTGRIVRWRSMGKIVFAELEDASGTIQIMLSKEKLKSSPPVGLSWAEIRYIDIFDFVEVTGNLGKTQAGEITIFASEIKILAKTIRPRPNTLSDKESKYRRRYLDMAMHKGVRDIFVRKAIFWQSIRNVLSSEGFIEVFLPVLERTTGGADAKPFITHHNSLDEDMYLRISLELYSKRAIGAGFEKVFSIGPVFRNEGVSDEHANEFNHIEWYWAYADYNDQMLLTKKIITQVAKKVYGKTAFETRDHKFDFANQWQMIDYSQIIKEKFKLDIFTCTDDELKNALKEHGIVFDGVHNRQRMIDNLWKFIRKDISGPAFLVNEPAFMSPLAKPKTDDIKLTERFHVIVAGTELANGYTEINDPIYQLEQFKIQQNLRDGGDDEAQMLDIDFIEMLEYGMPPTTGLGFSERLFWFLENITAREGTMFPQLKSEHNPTTKKIYPDLFLKKVQRTASINDKPKAKNKILSPISKEIAIKIVKENIANVGLQKHCLAVGMAMKSLAAHFGAIDGDIWEVAGILHDADWEKTKNNVKNHARETVKLILSYIDDSTVKTEEANKLIRMILSHNHHENGEAGPSTQAEWSLYCCDELTGIIIATALVSPNKRLSEISTQSVLKKMRSKNFAVAVDRESINMCEEQLGLPLEKFVDIILTGMKSEAEHLDL
jgi:lysyl-tRNA synthetase, class II